jgi:hypothetical protein
MAVSLATAITDSTSDRGRANSDMAIGSAELVIAAIETQPV